MASTSWCDGGLDTDLFASGPWRLCRALPAHHVTKSYPFTKQTNKQKSNNLLPPCFLFLSLPVVSWRPGPVSHSESPGHSTTHQRIIFWIRKYPSRTLCPPPLASSRIPLPIVSSLFVADKYNPVSTKVVFSDHCTFYPNAFHCSTTPWWEGCRGSLLPATPVSLAWRAGEPHCQWLCWCYGGMWAIVPKESKKSEWKQWLSLSCSESVIKKSAFYLAGSLTWLPRVIKRIQTIGRELLPASVPPSLNLLFLQRMKHLCSYPSQSFLQGPGPHVLLPIKGITPALFLLSGIFPTPGFSNRDINMQCCPI